MATATFEIPLSPVPQQFNIALANIGYTITVKYVDADDAGWVMDITDQNTGNPIVANIPLVTGVNLLSGLDYLNFNGTMTVTTDGDPNAVPTLDNLGIDSHLLFTTSVVDNG